MKFNKIASALILGLGLASSGAYAEDGKVTFSGSIIDAACSIAPGAQEQEVELGAIAAAQLENGGKSVSRDFQITLENCVLASDAGTGGDTGGDEEPAGRSAAANAVSVTFDGLKDGDMLALNPDSDAKGAGIVITDADYGTVALGEATSLYELTQGKNILNFKAYLQGDGTSNITTGEFDAVAKFTLNYE